MALSPLLSTMVLIIIRTNFVVSPRSIRMQSFHVYLHYYYYYYRGRQQIWMDIPLCLIGKCSGRFNYRI